MLHLNLSVTKTKQLEVLIVKVGVAKDSYITWAEARFLNFSDGWTTFRGLRNKCPLVVRKSRS